MKELIVHTLWDVGPGAVQNPSDPSISRINTFRNTDDTERDTSDAERNTTLVYYDQQCGFIPWWDSKKANQKAF